MLISPTKPSRFGYLELDAEPGRTYAARIAVAEGQVWTWAVETGPCTVVAGQPPVPADEMTPVDLGCEKPKHEIKPERVLLGVALLPVMVAGIGLYAAAGAPPIPDTKARGCADDCYREPDSETEPVAKLLIPARGEGCEFKRLWPGNSACILGISIDGFNAAGDVRSFRVRPGRLTMVFTAGFTRRGLAPFRGSQTDGLALEAEPGEVYALCTTTDKKRTWFWVVNNATGEVVAGTARHEGAPEKPSGHSPYCPRY
ncbi:MAG TPA: hypothetical protein VLA52_02705 [Thermohalobaculum sp.]|nr:hypothetical protein [Thermohalobaculum sp.]